MNSGCDSPWLRRYANGFHSWGKETNDGVVFFQRPTGLVETSFDTDGVHYEGRADLHSTLTLEIRTTLSEQQLQERVTLVWAVLGTQHPLLQSSVQSDLQTGQQKQFVVRPKRDPSDAIAEASKSVSYLQTEPDVDIEDLLKHVLNTGRIVDPTKSLSRLFILPLQPLPNGKFRLRLLQISAHMITDGISMYNWSGHLIDLLNQREPALRKILADSISQGVEALLPPAQEDLYPKIAGSQARQRWFWAIMRILRYVRKPLPSGFANPLRLGIRSSVTLDEKYPEAFDYSPDRKPRMSSGHCAPSLSPAASLRLRELCRESKATIGAGCFTLVGLVMMETEEEKHPDVPLADRSPFVVSFPLNPRPFFNYAGPYDSCMLAFSDGLVLPFLPTNTSFEGRFRLLVRSAQRQLRTYQKRLKDPVEASDSHAPLRMLAENYLRAIEYAEQKLPQQHKTGANPQGEFPANVFITSATCGVSSVGSVKQWLASGKYPLDDDDVGERDLAADFRDVRQGVRARNNEFLVGSKGDSEGNIHFGISYDASTMDEELVRRWKGRIERILERN
jgi:hypothetical protein